MEDAAETWLTVGEAMRLAGVRDKRTVHAWCDSGRVVSMRTPGNHRRIAASSLALVQRSANQTRFHTVRADPLVAVGEWYEASIEWDTWHAPPQVASARLEQLVGDLRELRRTFDRLEASVLGDLDRRSETRLGESHGF